MGDRVKSLAEVEVDNIHCSPFIYPASHAIVESYQIGQAWFPLGESTLTAPDNLSAGFHSYLQDLGFLRAGLSTGDWSKEGIQQLCLLCILRHQDTHLVQQQPHIIPSLPFAADALEEGLLVVFDIPCQLQFQVKLSLPRCIPACSDNIPLLFPSGLSLFPRSMGKRRVKGVIDGDNQSSCNTDATEQGLHLQCYEVVSCQLHLMGPYSSLHSWAAGAAALQQGSKDSCTSARGLWSI